MVAEDDTGCLSCDTGAGGSDAGTTAVEDTGGGTTEDTEVADTSPEDTSEAPDTAPDVAPDTTPVELPPEIVAVDTELSAETVAAGTTVMVRCIARDSEGTQLTLEGEDAPLEQVRLSPEASFSDDAEPGQLLPTRAGDATVACALPELGLVDPSPARLEIVPGPPYTLLTELDRHLIQAGERVEATCTTYDAYGNVIKDAEPRLLLDPFGEGVEVDGQEVYFERADLYAVTCHIDGATEEIADIVEVSPAAPAEMLLALQPDKPFYSVAEVIEVVATVTDAFGNEVANAPVMFTSEPEGSPFGQGRFRYDLDGLYIISATLDRGLGDEVPPIRGSVQVVVNGSGPSINCSNPADGSSHTAAAGSNFTIEGTVADPNGIGAVTVNGVDVPVDETGRFQTDVTVRFGINFLDIVASDSFGLANSTTCAFMTADSWAEEQSFIDDSVTLRMAQNAVDDDNRGGGINSLGDMLHGALNSEGLLNTLDGALSANGGTLKPKTCDGGTICPLPNPFGGCLVDRICTYGVGAYYQRLENRGSNSVSLDLIDGGLGVQANVGEIWLRIRLDYVVAGINGGTTGWVKVRNANVGLQFSLGLQNGRPQASVRSNTVSVSIGSLATDFSGLDGAIIDLVVSLVEGTIKNIVQDEIRNYIRSSFDEILDGVLGGLDISSLGTSFNVPRLTGGGDVQVGLGLRFSHLSVNNNRMLFGLGLRFTSGATQNLPSRGVPMPAGSVRLDPSTGRPIAAAIHAGVLNQVLHTLWRAGLINVTFTGADLGGGIPEEARAEVRAKLPPVIAFQSGEGDQITAQAMVGGLELDLVYPGLFSTPIQVSLGANATTGVRLVGETLEFENIAIDELYFSTGEVALDPATRAVLEDFLRTLVQSLLDDALNGALPVLPIPSFSLPNDLSQYGLPGGSVLGINGPSLNTSPTHAILEGSFGIQ
ncbi:MAG: hypothetical protein CMH57_07940 [Myxococcales bacterium]|nr:hypothetical protein [Myxococcales bacterium]